MTSGCACALDLGLDADGGQVLLDRLGDARIWVGVHRIERGREAVLEAGLLHELLRAFDIVRIALVGPVVARHQRRQHLVRRRRAAVDDAHDSILVDRHVDGLADAHVVQQFLGRVDGDVARLELLAVDDQVLVVGRVLDLQILGRRDAVAGDVDLALLESQDRDERLLADFDFESVEIRTVAEIVDIAREHQALAGPEPTGFLPKSAPSASTTSFGTREAKLSASTLRKVASGWVSVNLIAESLGVSMPEMVVAEPSAILSCPTIE